MGWIAATVALLAMFILAIDIAIKQHRRQALPAPEPKQSMPPSVREQP